MKGSNWAVVAIMLAIVAGCAGGGTSTFVERPGFGQQIADLPRNGPDELPGVIFPQVGVEPVLDQGSEGYAGLPAFPGSGGDTFSPVHKVSEAEYQTPGDGFVNSFGANNRAGVVEGEYVLIPEEGDIAWAMYSIPDLTGDRPVRIDVAVSPAELEAGSGEGLLLSYWVGVADYTLYHWDWFGPFTRHKELVINSEKLKDRYVSEEGTLHWVAVLYGDEEGGLPGITLQSGTVVIDPAYIANKPHYTAIDTIEIGSGGSGGGKGASGSTPVPGGEHDKSTCTEPGATKSTSGLDQSQFITIDWSHVEAFNIDDERNEAFQYRIYRLGPDDSKPEYIADKTPSLTVFTDPPDNGQGIDDPIPGATYRYYVRALNLNGFTPLSYPQEAAVPFFAPENFQATDGDHSDRVTLTWDAAEGATSYAVYRDNQDTPLATVSDEDATPASPVGPDDREWDDLTVPDYNLHTYWLIALNQYATSEFCVPSDGYITAGPLAGLAILPGQASGTAPHLVDFDASASFDPDNGSAPGDGIVKYEFDFGEGVGWEDFDLVSTAQNSYTTNGMYNPEVRVTDDEGVTAQATVEVIVNGAPVAMLNTGDFEEQGEAPHIVNFDASASTDGDGTIVDYEWDFDGNGVFNESDNGENTAQGNLTAQHTYSDFGSFDPAVRVTDDDGGQGTATVQLVVHGPWGMFGRDPQHTRLSRYNGPSTNALMWSYTAGEKIWSSPAIGLDGTLYVGCNNDNLYAINPDGSLKWSSAMGGYIGYSSPAIGADGTVYVGNSDSNLYAINPDGTESWSFTTGGGVQSSPVIGADGTVYVGCDDYKLYAINPDGTEDWSFDTGQLVRSSPAIGAGGTIFVGSSDNNLYAINPDGSLKWSFPTEYQVWSSPAIAPDGTVYVGSGDYNLYAINPDGTEKWSYTAENSLYASPAIGGDGTVYIGSNGGKLYAVYPDGSLKWSYTTGEAIRYSSPAVGADGIVYFGSEDHSIYAINAAGSLLWSYETGNRISSSPALGADGTMYIGSDDTKLYAFYTNPGNTPPTADIQATPTFGDTPLTVTFDATGSTDDGAIVKYEYDFDEGAGWQDYGASSTRQNIYETIGTYNAKVRVTDDDGASAIDNIDVFAGRDWWMFGRDSTHNSRSPFNGPSTNNLKWSFTTGGDVFSSPTIGADRTIFVGSDDNKLYAINPDGSEKWSFTTDNVVKSSPAIGADGTVYVGIEDTNALYAINPNGSEKWRFNATSISFASPAIATDGTIYIGQYDGAFWAINPDGTEKWGFAAGGIVRSSPAIASDGTVYVGTYSDDKLYAINPDGTEKWATPLGTNDIYSSPAIATDGTIYVGSDEYMLHAINPDGSVKWTFTTGYVVRSSPAIGADGTVYVGCNNDNFYAIDPTDGSEVWVYTTGGDVDSSPAIGADGTIYVGSDDSLVYAFNPDGTVLWTYNTGGEVHSSPAIGLDGTLYVGSFDNKLYAFQDLP